MKTIEEMKIQRRNKNLLHMMEIFHWLLIIMFGVAGIAAAYDWDVSPLANVMTQKFSVYMATLFIILKYAYMEAVHDAQKYPQKIMYITSNIARLSAGILLFIAYNFVGVYGWVHGIILMGTIYGAFWFVFNLKYNLTRNHFWWYAGQTSIIDKVIGSHWVWMSLILFIIGLIYIIK